MNTIKNILMIAVDDLRPELNCFGKQKLHTPNIDRLAQEATVYERAYCQYPQCMPSRASLMSGIRPKQFCNWSNQLCTRGEKTLPGYLRSQGFKTVSVGKVYHKPLDDAFSWDELHMDTFKRNPHGGMSHFFHDYQLVENQQKTVEKFKIGSPKFINMWEPLPPLSECCDAPDCNYIDAKVAERAIECLRRHKDSEQSFFWAFGFYRPHLPWVAPKKYWDLYKREEIDLADNPFFPYDGVGKSNLCDFRYYGDREVHELFSDLGRYEDDDFPVLSEAKQRECVHAYWACVSFMDAQVGRVLDELERCGKAEETAIILWGDNGWHLGEHKLWSKITNFDESTRVPLLVKVPGKTKGEKYRDLVELVDVFPTCCDVLGLERPAHLEGKKLPFSVDSKNSVPKHYVYCLNVSGQTILDERYRLTFYPDAEGVGSINVIEGRGQYELFDHKVDPKENRNVARDPAYGDVLDTLRDELHAYYGLPPS